MLVLARKVDESILIGEDIRIKIISVDKGSVKIGIDAPTDVTIIRDELARDVADMNIEASKHTQTDKLKDLSKLIKK